LAPENEVKLSQRFKVVLEMKKNLKGSQAESSDKRNFFISGLTKEKVILDQDIWASQIEEIATITCFLKVGEGWNRYEIKEFYTGKKATENSGKKKDRIVKSFSFLICDASSKKGFEKDLFELNP